MSEDFDSEEDLHFFAQPYLFEPEYTDEELRAMEEAPTQQQPLSQASERQRAMETWWCKCLHCHTMPTELESLCCTEWDIVMPQLEHVEHSADEMTSALQCKTEDTGFPPLLSRSVLDVFFHLPKVNWKRRPRPEGPGGTLTVE